MEPDDVARLVADLTLSGATEAAVVRAPAANSRWENRRLANVLIEKIFDSRVVNRETLRTHLPRILQVRQEVEVEIVGDNLFAVSFSAEADRRRAVNDGPWHFFRHLMLFMEPAGLQHPTDIKFDVFTTWIQCHNLPIVCMTPAMIRTVGERVGRVIEVDVNEGGSCRGQFARVRVSRSITEPLLRCVKIEQEGNLEERVVLIRYEKLPEFCSACGRVGHAARHCLDDSVDKEACTFSPWLCAGRVMDSRRGRSDWNGREQFSSRREGGERSMGSRSAGGSAADEEEGCRVAAGPPIGQGVDDEGETAVEQMAIIERPSAGSVVEREATMVRPSAGSVVGEVDGDGAPRAMALSWPLVSQEGDLVDVVGAGGMGVEV